MERLLPRANDTCSSTYKLNCSTLVVHNNWIVTKEAKIYRFREHLMWLYDGQDQYYSSETRKYFTYINPKPAATNNNISLLELKRLKMYQISALRTALIIGNLLDRVVVLPRFYCDGKGLQCPLNSLIHMKTFDSCFSRKYRENSFLQNPLVPIIVKKSISYQPIVSHTTRSPSTNKVDTNITSSDIIRLFQASTNKVINVGILDGIRITNQPSSTALNEKTNKAFKLCDYRQKQPSNFTIKYLQ